MTGADGDGGTAEVVGETVEDAAAAVAARPDTPDDEGAVAATLQTVSEGCVVTQDAVTDAVADASMYVSTAEGRAEYAAVEFEDTREAVVDLADVEVVQSRLEDFESEVAVIKSDAESLEERLRTAMDRSDDPTAVYEVARAVAELKRDADELQNRATGFVSELEEFEQSVANPERMVEELGADLAALEGFLDDLDETVAALDAGALDDAETDGGRAWFEASARHRANGLAFGDVRSELESIETLAERQGAEMAERVLETEQRLETLRDRWSAARDRLDDVAREEWRSRYGDRLAEVEAAVADREPPVDWGAVEADLAAHLDAPEPGVGESGDGQ